MSNIYIQEPPTHGKVLLHTSLGDIDIELWSREAPKASRNFVQLCLEGYYNGTIFHRVIKDFIAQGGDPTGTGEGGESIYGKPFKDEIHSRLRFVRRGLVAMANAGKDDNASQFFFTLGPTQELQGKHTVFGKVTGDTIYNLIKFNDLNIDGNERPFHPPKIKKTEVLFNPFDDIVPRETIKHETEEEPTEKRKKGKGKKDFKLLSFGDEAEEDEEISNKVVQEMRTKGKSAHDLANDPRLSKDVTEVSKTGDNDTDAGETIAQRNNMERLETNGTDEDTKTTKNQSNSQSRLEDLRRERIKLQKELKSSQSKQEQDTDKEKTQEKPQVVTEYLQTKAVYDERKKKLPKKASSSREEMTLAYLEKFQKKLSTISAMTERYGSDDEEEKAERSAEKRKASSLEEGEEEERAEEINDDSWLSHKLSFGDSHSKVLDANITDVDRYEIYDPRNPMTKRRREEAKKESQQKGKEKYKI